MKVLLLQSPTRAQGFGEMIRAEPLGLEMVAGGLRERGHEVRILDLRIEGKRALQQVLQSFRPHLCGISCPWTIDHPVVHQLASTLKEANPDIFVVVGGIHASLCPQAFQPPLDGVVVGEGEETIRELAEGLEGGVALEGVKGLFLPEDPRAFSARPLIEDLDTLPFPFRLRYGKGAGYYMGFQRPLALVETSRGCPHRCSFCAVWPFYRGTYRAKSPERVVAELESISDPFVLFVDDNFLAHAPRAEEIARLIERRRLKKRYTFQARADSILRHPDLLKRWKAIGLKAIFVGLEEVTDEGLRKIGKGCSVEVNDRALDLLKKLEVEAWASFIVDPSFGVEDFQRLRSYIRSRGVTNASFSVLTPLPGTRLYEERKGELTTLDYRLFDIAHAVLPTKLPLERFYVEFCSLYRTTYSSWKLIAEGFGAWLKGFPLPTLLKMLASAKRLSTPSYYMRAHLQGASPQRVNSLPSRRSAPVPGRAS